MSAAANGGNDDTPDRMIETTVWIGYALGPCAYLIDPLAFVRVGKRDENVQSADRNCQFASMVSLTLTCSTIYLLQTTIWQDQS